MREAVILAAGKGSRLQPLTDHTPKALLRLPDGMYLIDHHIQQLREAGVDDIYVVCGHLADQLSSHVQKRHPSCTIVRQKGSLGTAVDGLKAVEKLVAGDFVVVHGDHFFLQNPFKALVAKHVSGNITFLVERPKKSKSFGYDYRCLFNPRTKEVLSPYRRSVKPVAALQEMVLVDGGMILPSEIFNLISTSRKALGSRIEMREVARYTAKHGLANMQAVRINGWWANINDEGTYWKVVRRLDRKRP